MSMDVGEILRALLASYRLPILGIHGVDHWARVYENGLRLAEQTEADREVVALFALLHDSQRINESHDPDHGPRAAEHTAAIRRTHLKISDEAFALLYRACAGHTHELTHPDIMIQTCWDADRLDLGRVGITPHPSRLCTEAAKHPEMIRWADGRAQFRVVPSLVREEWKLNLDE